ELRAVRARARVGHGEQVRPVELQLGVELVGELEARGTAAGTGRGTRLARAWGRWSRWCPRRAPRSCARSPGHDPGTAGGGSGHGWCAGWRKASLPRGLLSVSRRRSAVTRPALDSSIAVRILPHVSYSGSAGVPEKAT